MRFLFYTEFYATSDFFLRLAETLRDQGVEATILSPNVSEVFSARRSGFASVFLKCRGRKVSDIDLENASRGLDVICGSQTPHSAAKKYRAIIDEVAVWAALSDEPGVVCVWNGLNSAGLAIREAAYKNNCKSLYFEIANIPGKIFVDHIGVNAASSLMNEAAWPSDGDSDDLFGRFTNWRDQYLEDKSRDHVVPQAKHSHYVPVRALCDHILALFTGSRTISTSYALGRTTQLLKHKVYTTLSESRRSPEDFSGYVFFPMQVSTDTQVVLNSDLDLWQSLERVREIAGQKNLPLVVKPHPAEPNPEIAARLNSLSEDGSLFVVGGNTFQWILGASLVVTINSTVGLEALIAGKEVQFLGRTFFRNIDRPNRLHWYVCECLVDADYFSTSPVSEDACRKILGHVDQTIPNQSS